MCMCMCMCMCVCVCVCMCMCGAQHNAYQVLLQISGRTSPRVCHTVHNISLGRAHNLKKMLLPNSTHTHAQAHAHPHTHAPAHTCAHAHKGIHSVKHSCTQKHPEYVSMHQRSRHTFRTNTFTNLPAPKICRLRSSMHHY